ETTAGPSACRESPVIPNESRPALNTAVIQFPWGPGATRHRHTSEPRQQVGRQFRQHELPVTPNGAAKATHVASQQEMMLSALCSLAEKAKPGKTTGPIVNRGITEGSRSHLAIRCPLNQKTHNPTLTSSNRGQGGGMRVSAGKQE
ncbi:hypothetical protein KUCAC02_024440, partial [Chaenocephalus aceratus]